MPSKQWDDEESETSTPPSSPPVTAVRRRQFDDEEDDSDVLDSWDAAEDSEVEREKEKKAAEVKAKALAEAEANKKSKTERRAERIASRKALDDEDDSSEEEETEAERRQRLRATEKAADLGHAQDLFDDFGDIGVPKGRKAVTPGAAIALDVKDPSNTVNLGDLPIFKPSTKTQFETLRNTLAPIITASGKKAHYTNFLQEFAKQLAADLPSDQVKKISSSLTALANEKMKQEKTADKGGKKTKAAKTKTSLVGARQNDDDFAAYNNNDNDDGFGDDDFM